MTVSAAASAVASALATGAGLRDTAPMARPKLRNLPDLHHLACPGAEIAVRATPRAASDGLSLAGDQVKITVTAVPENGQANKAVRAVLAAAMGVAPTQLTLVRGASARDKLFRYDGSSRS